MFDRYTMIKLIPVTVTYGDLRQEIETEGSATEVFAELSSITRQEFLAAGSLGLKPSLSRSSWRSKASATRCIEATTG